MEEASIKALVYAKYSTEAELARILGWTRQKLNLTTHMKREPNLEDIVQLSKALDTGIEKLILLFLQERSQIKQQQ